MTILEKINSVEPYSMESNTVLDRIETKVDAATRPEEIEDLRQLLENYDTSSVLELRRIDDMLKVLNSKQPPPIVTGKHS